MNTEKRITSDLLHEPVGKTLVRFSFPFMLSVALQTLYATADTIIVGQVLAGRGISAVSNASQLMQMMLMLCVGFSSAGGVLIAQAEGAGRHERTQQIIGTLIRMEFVLCVVLSLISVLFGRRLLQIMRTPEEALIQAQYYTVICGLGMLFTGAYNMFSAVFQGLGDSRHPLLFVVIASVCNIVLDMVFVLAFHWDVAGTALATVIGQAISVAFCVRFLYLHSSELHLRLTRESLRPDREVLGQLLRIGVPMAIQGSAIQFSFLFVSRMVNTLGVDVSAAFGVSQKLRNLPGILTQGLNLGASSMIGQNLGAGQIRRVSQTVNRCLVLSLAVNFLFGLFFGFAPVFSFRFFTQDPSVLAWAAVCMTAVVAELPGLSLLPACNALVSAQGFAALSMAVAFLDAFAGRVLFCWLFGSAMGLGAQGFFFGYAMGTYMTGVPLFLYYVTGLWKRRKVLLK